MAGSTKTGLTKAGSNGKAGENQQNSKDVLLSMEDVEQNNTSTTQENSVAWMQGVKKSLKVFSWLAIVVLIWLLLNHFEVLDKSILDTGNFILSIFLFMISIPTSLFFRMDTMMERYAADYSAQVALLAALPLVLFNFMLIGAYMGWRKKFKK